MYTRIGILFMSLLVTIHLQAQSPSVKKITLPEALSLGVENSKELMVSNAKVKEAHARLQTAQSKVLPEISISGMYMHINTPNVSMSGSSDNSGSADSPLAAFSNLHNIMLGQASASLPVFNGFRIRNNRVMNDYLEQAEKYDAQTTKNKVKLNTAKAVFQYYELLETRKVVEENLKQEQQRVKEFREQEAQNLLARNDRLKAELQANNVELALSEVNNNVKLAEYNLVILLGLPDTTTIELDTTGMFNAVKPGTWEEYLNAGLTNRSELKTAEFQMKADESGYKSSRADRLPTVALTAGYINAYIPDVVTVTNALNAGVSVKYNITGAFESKHSIQQAKSRYEQAEISHKITTDQVKTDIRSKYLKSQQAMEKLAITERAIEQAQENFQISQNKYNQGLLILSEYLDADVALLQARINYATAKAESMIAYYELQESTGNLQ